MAQYGMWTTPIPLGAIMEETDPHKMAEYLTEMSMPTVMGLSAVQAGLPTMFRDSKVVSHSFLVLGSSLFLTILFCHDKP